MLREAELRAVADSENNLGGPSETMYFIGLDVHKKTISHCVKDAAGRVHLDSGWTSAEAKIERLFAWLQNFRRVVVRYERHAENFLGML